MQSEGDKQNAHEVTKADSLNLKDKRHEVIWVFINRLLPKYSLYCPSFRYPPVPDKHGPSTTTLLTREDQGEANSQHAHGEGTYSQTAVPGSQKPGIHVPHPHELREVTKQSWTLQGPSLC